MEQHPGTWRLDDATIARVLSREDLASHWIFGKHMVVHPGEAAMWLKDGQEVRVVTEGEKMKSGIMDRLKSLLYAGGMLTVVMMDVTDITLNFRLGVDKETVFADDPDFYGKLLNAYSQDTDDKETISGLVEEYSQNLDTELQKRKAILTKDRESVAFDVRLTFRVVPEKGLELFKLFGAKNHLQQTHIESLARQRLESAVFVPTLARYTGDQLRQDLGILAKVNKMAKSNLGDWLEQHGVGLQRLAINPALTGEERKAIIHKEKKALESAASDRHQHDLQELRRDYDRLVMREKLAGQLTQVRAEKDEEKQKILHATFLKDQEKKLSAAQMADQIERIRLTTKLEAQKKLKELEVLGVKKKWEIEKERMAAQAELEMDKMRVLAQEYRKNKEAKAQQKLKEMELKHAEAREERDHVEKLLEIGAREGALTNGLLEEAIRQQSVRKALDQGDAVGKAFGEAEGRRTNGQQQALPGQPSISITGQGPMLVETGQREAGEPQRALPDAPPPALPSPSDDHTVVTICPGCGESVPEGSNFCGMCGNKIGE